MKITRLIEPSAYSRSQKFGGASALIIVKSDLGLQSDLSNPSTREEVSRMQLSISIVPLSAAVHAPGRTITHADRASAAALALRPDEKFKGNSILPLQKFGFCKMLVSCSKTASPARVQRQWARAGSSPTGIPPLLPRLHPSVRQLHPSQQTGIYILA